jgi:hypothetical protein
LLIWQARVQYSALNWRQQWLTIAAAWPSLEQASKLFAVTMRTAPDVLEIEFLPESESDGSSEEPSSGPMEVKRSFREAALACTAFSRSGELGQRTRGRQRSVAGQRTNVSPSSASGTSFDGGTRRPSYESLGSIDDFLANEGTKLNEETKPRRRSRDNRSAPSLSRFAAGAGG